MVLSHRRLPTSRESHFLMMALIERTASRLIELHADRTAEALSLGQVYSIYRSLEEAGWVEPPEVEDGDDEKRLYRLSSEGYRALKQTFDRRARDFAAFDRRHLAQERAPVRMQPELEPPIVDEGAA